MSKKNDQEEGEKLLDKQLTDIDRGVELILRNKKKQEKPKTFQIKFDKTISLFKRVYHFNVDFGFDITKKP